MADNEAVKKALAESQEATKRSREQAEALMASGKPTPTQEEVDRARLGEHLATKEDDGSGPEPVLTRQVESRKPAAAPTGYSTRASTAKPASSAKSE